MEKEEEEDDTPCSIFTSSSVEYIYTHDDEHLLFSELDDDDGDIEVEADDDFVSSSSVDYIYTHDDDHFFDVDDDDDVTITTGSSVPIASKNSKTKSKTKIEYMPRSLLPSKETILASSTNRLTRMELQKAIQDVKRFVESRFESDLNVFKVNMHVAQNQYIYM